MELKIDETPHVTASIATKNRYHTSLPLAIMSVAHQTVLPKALFLFDDGDHKDLREDPVYKPIFHLLSRKGIAWFWIYADHKGQVACHQKSIEMAQGDYIWRIDDDNSAEPNALEMMLGQMTDGVGAVGPRVIIPDSPPFPAFNGSSKIEDISSKMNIQWCDFKNPVEVDHLHNTFLFRKEAAKHGYCSPPDEMVSTVRHGDIAISQLNPEIHKVVAFDRRHDTINRKFGSKFIVGKRSYDGALLTIKTDTSSTRVTPNHLLTVKWSENIKYKFCVYLMRKNNWWRIGTTKMCRNNGTCGPSSRLREETGEDLWILGIFPSQCEALYHEQLWSHTFNVPDLQFVSNVAKGYKIETTQLQKIWSAIDSETGAKKLLAFRNLMEDFPLWQQTNTVHKRQAGSLIRWEIRAVNLLDGMMIPVDTKNQKAEWKTFSVERTKYSGDVFSLDVEHGKHYVSGGAIVHNCLDLSPVGHREETIFSYEMRRAGWKLIVEPKATVWHLRNATGGIRSYDNAALWEHDEKIFQDLLKKWGVALRGRRLFILDSGMGDHFSFKMVLPEIKKKYANDSLVIAVSYPEIFEDEKDVELISIAEGKQLESNVDRHNLYKWMWDNNWKGHITDAYRKLYL